MVPEFFDELGAGLGDELGEPDCFQGLEFLGFDGVDELERLGAGLVAGLGRWGGLGWVAVFLGGEAEEACEG